MHESNRIEFKRELNDSLEKEVVAFLNYREGGIIYLGIDDKTKITIGIDDIDATQLKIKDRIKNNINPSTMGLFEVITEARDGKYIIKIVVAGGLEKPYYLSKMGMSTKGCYIRVGNSTEPMPVRMIEDLFAARIRDSIGTIKSRNQNLSFEQLKIYYNENSLKLNNKFADNLELLTEDGKYNYAAYLLSDVNGLSIKVGKYAGTTRADLIENEEYGFCSIIKATKSVLEKFKVENKTFTKITDTKRSERKLLNTVALREIIINAIIHNNYSNEVPPKFELFSDRLEVTSAGGLPLGFDENEFFMGYSVPQNKELMRVFRDLDMVEHMGSGVPRVLEYYPRSIYA
jgi:ATP-dependent DNA helicase RecG